MARDIGGDDYATRSGNIEEVFTAPPLTSPPLPPSPEGTTSPSPPPAPSAAEEPPSPSQTDGDGREGNASADDLDADGSKVEVEVIGTAPPLPSPQYKVVSWNPLNYEGLAYPIINSGRPSNSSFADVARREGLTDEDFKTCFYLTEKVRNKGALPKALPPLSTVENPVRDCVLEKLINTIARDRWTLIQATSTLYQPPNDGFYTLYFQRNA